ncbi:MAG: hypothetical protein DRG24_04520 [Epsilonproteobacteria bacterium]|nr:MAG: hypothetical protein DRG24_04520 [Campylobacterota bacterium]
MKPLTSSSLLLERIDNATDGIIRSVSVQSPSIITITLSVQDRGREYDWINIVFEVSGIVDARLVDEAKLSFLDMSEGISVIVEGDQAGVGIGKCSSIANLKFLPLYLLGNSLKYEELNFSE